MNLRCLAVFLAALPAAAADVPLDGWAARLERGGLTGLATADGSVYVRGAEAPAVLRATRGDFPVTAQEGPGQFLLGDGAGALEAAWEVDEDRNELVVSHRASADATGVWGVEFPLGRIPLDMNVIVPVMSGLRLTRNTPGSQYSWDYPMVWEAGLVVVEGDTGGFYIWAEDERGKFKRLTVDRDDTGWQLGFITMPFAPFDERTAVEGVRWHVGVYQGDWREGVRPYRRWMVERFEPAAVEDQQPAWVKDARVLCISWNQPELLKALAERLDPAQTVLYLPSWRAPGYDRDYPNYADVIDGVAEYIDEAHAYGFKVMLHVNYFGCDPLNPLYEEFEPYHLREPFSGDKQWWLWEDADPTIKFAYINPAYKPWRDLFVQRMVDVVETLDADALHLDQTLVIMNDANGLIGGMSMIDGNVALHRELREALPEVALSGEGLNEVTYRHEAFAQRHVMSIDHTRHTWNLDWLKAAHPVSSYLFRPYTVINGYLGYPPPVHGQFYAAWNEAYEHYGVIPTIKLTSGLLSEPLGFTEQLLNEAALWQAQRVTPDLEAPWPYAVAFPYRTAAGQRVLRMRDHRLTWGGRRVSLTVRGETRVEAAGSIPGWRGYNEEALIGLDPNTWYPVTNTPRDHEAFHVTDMPDSGFTIGLAHAGESLAFVRTQASSQAGIDLTRRLDEAVSGWRGPDGQVVTADGPETFDSGAHWTGAAGELAAHPPYKGNASGGEAFLRYELDLPQEVTRFVSAVGLRSNAVGEDRSDGVRFKVAAKAAEETASKDVLTATAEKTPLTLDLAPFAGKRTAIELSVGPGPAGSPSFDWAHWTGPRIEREVRLNAPITMVLGRPWRLALAGAEARPLPEGSTRLEVTAPFPGGAYLLAEEPPTSELPLDLTQAAYETVYAVGTGIARETPQYAAAAVDVSAIGGVERSGFNAHPPDLGRTIIDIPIRLPQEPAELRAYVGLRDESQSNGVGFRVEVNAQPLLQRDLRPAKEWEEVRADLTLWAGQPVVLSLVTDALGDNYYDWAVWGEPRLLAKE